ncbi:DUF2577 domain-containing protein [Defluviitalea raffinosedens]|uniref:DUF2577 domain-containing protein n=2 Tax=Defluviitalea raffinosedens TaxID=1450156 RepID=A0A7C8HE77_9FIRM|nr:DUF2577 domain-containing protein [Defluviitalea raffinosedens]
MNISWILNLRGGCNVDMVKLIKKAGMQAMEQGAPVNILLGTVTQVNPLVISVDQKFPITGEFLYLTDNVRDYKTKLSFDNPSVKHVVKDYTMQDEEGTNYKIAFQDKAINDVTIYNGLKVGERVLLLRVQGGQKFVVLNRVVEA